MHVSQIRLPYGGKLTAIFITKPDNDPYIPAIISDQGRIQDFYKNGAVSISKKLQEYIEISYD